MPAVQSRICCGVVNRGIALYEGKVIAPGGKVIVGTWGGEYAVRGFFDAYDANTGQRAWRFYTVPGDPSKPFEHEGLAEAAKTWSGDWWKLGGAETSGAV